VSWLGRKPYDEAHALQIELRDAVIAGAAHDSLLLLEHDPVITFGRRGPLDDLRVGADVLAERGIAVRATERGGRATYHGPGQLVGYLIAPLRSLAPDVTTYVCRVEEAMIRASAALGVEAFHHPEGRGVWTRDGKLGFVGIAVRRGVCWHGFALNVDPDLSAFDLIRPCGLDVPVTSLAYRVCPAPPMAKVAALVGKEIVAAMIGGTGSTAQLLQCVHPGE
jgi:lipoyl(octanoyl) transferase